ncbi:MAG: hypothetical protein EPN88_00085, partial [Bacteroidetes bacterium]
MNKITGFSSKAIFFIPALRTILFIAAGTVLVNIPPFRGKNLRDVSMWWPLLCIAVNLLTIGILIVLVKSEGKTFKDLFNHEKDKKKTLK